MDFDLIENSTWIFQYNPFVCIACGRVAELPKQLCNPRDIVLMVKEEPLTKII
jgi:hypothetical protein